MTVRRAAILAVLFACTWTATPAGERPSADVSRAARAARSRRAADPRLANVDALFSKFTPLSPGCAVGVAENGVPRLAKGYGVADLEHDVPITADSIFEAGSVSKQFTAAAVLLLERDGKLSIDDPVRKYIPELPDYGKPLLIRHMLTHTSGLRDWGSVAAIAGWPRTSRVHTHAHVLDIVSRQHALNFPPGARFSYSNTGFNLAAIIVSRVSGMPFPEFTRRRLFEPLGMTHTSWRDDYTRVVKGRAIAYEERDGAYHSDMPFENVYGNGGLLTTVGDLLKWNENFNTPVVGDAALAARQQQPGKFNDGRTHGYGLGLYLGEHRGLREVYHSGSTAGYSAFLTRFPDQRVSVAVLCNLVTNATDLAHDVADIVLADRLQSDPPAPQPSPREVTANAGLYRSELTGVSITIGRDSEVLRGRKWSFDGHGHAKAIDRFGSSETYVRVEPAHPTRDSLALYAGSYVSDDTETELTAAIDGDRLVLKRRAAAAIPLTPIYADAFRAASLGTIVFHRDGAGHPVEFSVVQERVWNMPFRKKQ